MILAAVITNHYLNCLFKDFEPTTTSTYIEQNSTSQPGPSSSLAGLSRIENESSSSRKPFHCPKCDSSFPELHHVVNHWAKAHYKGKHFLYL